MIKCRRSYFYYQGLKKSYSSATLEVERVARHSRQESLQPQSILRKRIRVRVDQVYQEPVLTRHLGHQVWHICVCPIAPQFDRPFLFLLYFALGLSFLYLSVEGGQTLFLPCVGRGRCFSNPLGDFWLSFAFFAAGELFCVFCQAFFFFEYFEGFEKFGSSFVFLNLFGADLVKELLCVGSDLAEAPAFHVFVDLFPVFAIALNKFFEKIGLGRAPSSIPLFPGCSVATEWSIHF